jgi:hypothetical protein
MATRGVVTTLDFYIEQRAYGPTTAPLVSYQNHFEGTRTITNPFYGSPVTYSHNFYTITPYRIARNEASNGMSITFAATATNVALVETAMANRYSVDIATYRWTTAAGIDNPSAYALFAIFFGHCYKASSDFSTITLDVRLYADATNADLPWQRVPWTIVGPLSARK